MTLDISTVVVSVMDTNCYFVRDQRSDASALIDPGRFSAELDELLKNKGLIRLDYILITHGHFDHIMGLDKVLAVFPDAKVVIGKKDASCLGSNLMTMIGMSGYCRTERSYADIEVSGGEKIPFGDSYFEVIPTPGHTMGSVSYLFEDRLFTGDALFDGSVGRTDFFGGSMSDTRKTCRKFMEMNDDIIFYPGHGGPSTIGIQKITNPYFIY